MAQDGKGEGAKKLSDWGSILEAWVTGLPVAFAMRLKGRTVNKDHGAVWAKDAEMQIKAGLCQILKEK